MNTTLDEEKPFLLVGTGTETVAPGLHIVRGQGQSFVAETDAGLVLIDAGPGGAVTRGMIEAVRLLSDAPIHALCYSHGHIGYNSGVPNGWSMRRSAGTLRLASSRTAFWRAATLATGRPSRCKTGWQRFSSTVQPAFSRSA